MSITTWGWGCSGGPISIWGWGCQFPTGPPLPPCKPKIVDTLNLRPEISSSETKLVPKIVSSSDDCGGE